MLPSLVFVFKSWWSVACALRCKARGQKKNMTSFGLERSWSVCITRVFDHRNSFSQLLDSDTYRIQGRLEFSAPRRPTANSGEEYAHF